MSSYEKLGRGYKRLRESWSGTFARRSERLMEKHGSSA